MKKNVGTILTVIILIVVIVGIGFVGYGYYQKQTMEVKNPLVTMEVENFGTVTMELYPDQAPNTVANFIKLANNGFYNGLTFHRIIKDFMIQGGDKNGDGTGSATLNNLNGGGDKEYCIPGEFIANGIKNTLKCDEGTLAMARSDYTSYSQDLDDESYNSGSSQFFIMTTSTNNSLNGYYTAFGKVKEGMDVVKKIAEVEVKARESGDSSSSETSADSAATTDASAEVSQPVNPPKITSIKVETYGVDYGDPVTLEPFDLTSWMYKKYGLDPSTLSTQQ